MDTLINIKAPNKGVNPSTYTPNKVVVKPIIHSMASRYIMVVLLSLSVKGVVKTVFPKGGITGPIRPRRLCLSIVPWISSKIMT